MRLAIPILQLITTLEERYGKRRTQKSLVHFITGKMLAVLIGFGATIIVVRHLPIADFARYATLAGLIEYITALSGLGLAHAMVRYLPELYSAHYRQALHRFALTIGLARIGAAIALGIASLFFKDKLGSLLGVADAMTAFKWFLCVATLRSISFFFAQSLDALLLQGWSQVAFNASALIRLIWLAWHCLYLGQPLSLIQVVLLDLAAECVCLSLLGVPLLRAVLAKQGTTLPPEDDAVWMEIRGPGIRRFAAHNYLQHLAILPAGNHTNRLLGGASLTPMSMASYGFALTLLDYVQRYLPAQLLAGVLRPLMVVRYKREHSTGGVISICQGIFHLNMLLLGVILQTILVGGSEMMALISGGKYGESSAQLLAVMMLVLMLETRRSLLEAVVQTVESSHILIASNLMLTASAFVNLLALPVLGPMSFPVVSLLALLVVNARTATALARRGHRFALDWPALYPMAIIIGVGASVGWLLRSFLPWPAALALSLALTIAALWKTQKDRLMASYRDLFSSTERSSAPRATAT